ncbi:hypothetical protein HDU76_000926 [Blyttiomyces sp. JEL0837]|nr:hypothetical protein HDU76_000926 [Blyttiomyces sp. JEL0837]
MKESVRDNLPKRITQIEFGVFAPQDVKKLSVVELYERNLYDLSKPNRPPMRYGVLDRRLDCVGHFGVVRLTLPVFHIGYFKLMITVLQNICKTCSCLLVDEAPKRTFLKRLRNPAIDGLQRKEILKALNNACKKVSKCPHCESINGTVKKVGALKVIHEKFKKKTKTNEDLVFRNEDDLTVLVSEIIQVNTEIRAIIEDGFPPNKLMEHWDYLQLQCAMFITSDLPGVPSHLQSNLQKIKKGLCQRLKGKHGRFRGNLSGKRVDFSGRTVISPDPNLRIDQVAFPERVARVLTYPEKVTAQSISRLRENIINVPEKHPGATYVQTAAGAKKFLKYGDRNKIADDLRVGDTVERHLHDGDIVLFNRQPSLHKLSIMSHFAKIRPWRTFRFNECVCTPYNADFDGDEMNLHVPQTEEARAEAQELMGTFEQRSIPLSRWGTQLDASFCRNDGHLIIMNSEIMSGVIDKSIVGDGNKKSLFYTVLRDCGPVAAADCMNRVAKVSARWLANQGFSIGIDDVQPGENLRTAKETMVERAYAECDEFIRLYQSGQMEREAGSTQEQTLEGKISRVLSRIRDDVGNICVTELNKYNAPLIMSLCGSKGSKINVSQMVAIVGQQIISGSRIPNGFLDRSLPHFPKNSKLPAAKGFVRNSFYSGLAPPEFFFHAVSGREGLVDTAVKTAETGYMQRRLMKACAALEDLTSHYDLSVRNSTGGVIQFTYGDDGLDPVRIEGSINPVEFPRNWAHCLASRGINDTPLLPYQIKSIFESEKPGLIRITSEQYVETIENFLESDVIKPMIEMRKRNGMPDGNWPTNADTRHLRNSVSSNQLRMFLDICKTKFQRARIEPGTAVGAVGAQSIGEPGTQMTLKTFHFAGVASMNVTLGVPRIKEIINASKNIATPIMKAVLVKGAKKSRSSALVVKGRVDKTLLEDIVEYVEEVITPHDCYLRFKVDLETISRMQLEVTLDTIGRAILKSPKLKLNDWNVQIEPPSAIRIRITSDQKGDKADLLYTLQALKRAVPKVIVKGIPTVTRAVAIQDQKTSDFEVHVQGYGLLQIMGTEGVDGSKAKSNHVLEHHKVLGIEAARITIVNEILYTMQSHGMTIDYRHVMLLADLMTFKGDVLGITRFGIAKMKDSVLMLASFEKTTDHLFEASFFGKRDAINGVSECIIMGIPMSIGTGLFKLLNRTKVMDALPPMKELLFDNGGNRDAKSR